MSKLHFKEEKPTNWSQSSRASNLQTGEMRTHGAVWRFKEREHEQAKRDSKPRAREVRPGFLSDGSAGARKEPGRETRCRRSWVFPGTRHPQGSQRRLPRNLRPEALTNSTDIPPSVWSCFPQKLTGKVKTKHTLLEPIFSSVLMNISHKRPPLSKKEK